jgi:hypothetical protein
MIQIKNMPHDSGIVVAWKDGMVSLSLGTTTYEEKAREKSINVGLDHATKLLGKLHKDEYDSPPCVERASKHMSPNKTLPPPMLEQNPPSNP